jgi:hypothetical protein
MPNLRTVAGFVAGSDSLFDGNGDHERQFLHAILDLRGLPLPSCHPENPDHEHPYDDHGQT